MHYSISGTASTLTNAELSERVVLTGLSRFCYQRRFALGCCGALLLSICSTLFFYLLLNSYHAIGLYISIVLVPMYSIIFLALISHFALRSRRPFLHELHFRHGLMPLSTYAKEEITSPHLLYTFLVSGCGLPYGKRHFLRVRISSNNNSNYLSIISPNDSDVWFNESPLKAISRKENSLSRQELIELSDLASILPYGRVKDYGLWTVRDGFPCEFIAINHITRKQFHMRCNLAGKGSNEEMRPDFQLLKALMTMESRWNSSSEIICSCDYEGEIHTLPPHASAYTDQDR